MRPPCRRAHDQQRERLASVCLRRTQDVMYWLTYLWNSEMEGRPFRLGPIETNCVATHAGCIVKCGVVLHISGPRVMRPVLKWGYKERPACDSPFERWQNNAGVWANRESNHWRNSAWSAQLTTGTLKTGAPFPVPSELRYVGTMPTAGNLATGM